MRSFAGRCAFSYRGAPLARLLLFAGLLPVAALAQTAAPPAPADAGTPVQAAPLNLAKEAADKTQQAVVGAVRTNGPASCVTSECHKGYTADKWHQDKAVECVKCHTNIDGSQPHKGKLDEQPTKVMCATCHKEAVEKQSTGKHKDSLCESCHGSVHDDFKDKPYSECKGCHKDEAKSLKMSVHGLAKQPVVCSDCHGSSHSPFDKKDPLSPVSPVLQVGTCTECHDTQAVKAFRTSVHGQGLLKSGLTVAPTCSDCHGAHDIAKVHDPASKLSRQNVVNTCGKCHGFMVSRWEGSAHGQKWAEEQKALKSGTAIETTSSVAPDGQLTADGKPRTAPVCTTCHTGHFTFDNRVFGNNLKLAEMCAQCHKTQSESYLDSFHGKATELGLVAATCADCHTAHEMLPTKDPHSSVNPANLEKTCGECHQPINANFATFDPHISPKKSGGIVHWVWLFMTTLLISVLSFFAVHTLLWLQRSIVGVYRKELHGPVTDGAVWVRRFNGVHIAIHVTLVTSFLVLAATGLPLKFAGFGWAHWIEVLFGGIGPARWLHRAAGVVTFGYAAYLVAYLFREIVMRRRFDLLWGWKSLVPNGKDLVDLFANIRWFLYLGPPPKLDRWAYWEKFDFFAVFWGVPIIGGSGLMLWKPLWFTGFLPGWVINIAYMVHSDEALLATGFIFFFHFFHTHLRPEAFPLDPVIFLGGMPLERFKEERPLEYKRLVDAGQLEMQLMPRPTEKRMRMAYRFAWTALAVGVFLGAFLIIVGVMNAL